MIHGDCIDELGQMSANSIDAVVTDPPYGLAFMGKSWDDFAPREYQEFCQEWGEKALRVLKPGGYLLACSGTRTYHRMVVGLEDAGFTIKDQIAWMYGNGFPKGQDISKAIDKHLGKAEEREKIGEKELWGHSAGKGRGSQHANGYSGETGKTDTTEITAPATEEAEQWKGWNTALKPAHEPVVVAQSPREGTYAENVLEYGVGGLNIEDCRIGAGEGGSRIGEDAAEKRYAADGSTNIAAKPGPRGGDSNGRWPPNVVIDEEAAEQLDWQSGTDRGAKAPVTGNEPSQSKKSAVYGDYSMVQRGQEVYDFGGGASRFFYCAKARKTERNAGLPGKNDIATLKPINLMRYLVRLVTPPNGTVLDPFAGSGTTGCAAVIEGMNYILIEKRERFATEIIPQRIKYWQDSANWDKLKDHNELPATAEMRNGNLTEFVETQKGDT